MTVTRGGGGGQKGHQLCSASRDHMSLPPAGEAQALTAPVAGTGGSTTCSLTCSDPSHISHVLSCHHISLCRVHGWVAEGVSSTLD